MICTYLGVIIFVGLTAWDTQRIKNMFMEHGTADENGQKLALMGALMLYLDFINLFIYLLRLIGGRD
jgi:FtsH-binding integral membrane protein